MSGNPIIQDGKLVGAVTHALVNDPITGYGILLRICWRLQRKGGKSMDFYKVPLGFGMALAMNANALNVYSAMTEIQKQEILNKAHNARSEREMHEIVNSIMK